MKLEFFKLLLVFLIINVETKSLFAFDFEFKYRSVLSADAIKYVVEQTNITRTNEGGISYWNPANNGSEARLTQLFSLEQEIDSAFLNINYIYINNYGGNVYGVGSLWASKNGTDWVQIVDAPTPNEIAAGYVYSDFLPASVVGGKELWIQARLRSESFNIAAQFLRFDENRTDNCFELQINYRESAPILTTLTQQGGLITGGGSYPAGSSATLAAQPNSGFVFKRWTGDASGSVNPLEVVMNAPKTIGAEFSPDTTDIDSDGLTAYDEVIVFGTDPAVADTDKDGITDGVETGVGVFSVVDGVFTWDQARVDAVAKGGRLATFGSAMEWQGALRAIGSDALVGRIGIWLGATDQVEEGAWRWVTGEEFTFQNWADGEPDNANDSDFAEVAGTELAAAGKWYDRRSTAVRDGYLLEKGHASSPVKADSDDDGLNDNEEKVAGSHPLMADTDSDGLDDVQELRLSQTSPINSDTDGDGLADAQEDPDGDGLTHTQEILESKTNPLVADSDSDGFDDRFELVSGFDPTRGDSTPDAITTILPAVEFRFNAAVGVSYRIEGSDDLQSWVIIEPSVIGQGGVVTRLYSIEAHPTRYLRVRRN